MTVYITTQTLQCWAYAHRCSGRYEHTDMRTPESVFIIIERRCLGRVIINYIFSEQSSCPNTQRCTHAHQVVVYARERFRRLRNHDFYVE